MGNPVGSLSTITIPNGNKYLINGIPYGICSTSASTQNKEVTIYGITELTAGLSLRVLFSNAQSYDGTPTLQVSSLSAKNIIRRTGENAAKDEWCAGDVVDFMYNGTYWVIVNSNNVATTSEVTSYLGLS